MSWGFPGQEPEASRGQKLCFIHFRGPWWSLAVLSWSVLMNGPDRREQGHDRMGMGSCLGAAVAGQGTYSLN